jgi:hypothetical protein
MSEYSTVEHILQVHENHSEQLAISSNDGHVIPAYKHAEFIKPNLPFEERNATHVSCSPKFSLRKLNILYIYIKIRLLQKCKFFN